MLEWVTSIVASLGYVGIFALMFLETLFPPLPSEVVMPFAGFAASEGKLGLLGVILSGTLGSLAGASSLYLAGRLLSDKSIERFITKRGKAVGVTRDDVHKAQKWFDSHGYSAVFLGRLLPGIRSLISLPAGMRAMKPLPFLVFSLLGTGIWTGLLSVGGYVLGEQYKKIGESLNWLTPAVLLVIIVAVGFLLIRRMSNRS